MKYQMAGLKLGFCALALGLSGWANAACNMVGTNASSVQADSGNGNYVCTQITTSNNQSLADVTGASGGLTYTTTGGKVNWKVPTADVNGKPYPTFDVDLVSVADSKGKRCNYSYADQQWFGDGLTTPEGTLPTRVTVCADRIIAKAPPADPIVIEPFSTFDDGCDATFTNASQDGKFDVAIGYSKQIIGEGVYAGGLYEGVAICAGVGQIQCVNECVPREYDSLCQPDVNGRYPLSCAQCEWEFQDPPGSTKDLKYCWHHENQVVIPDPSNAPTIGTFLPSPRKKSVSTQIDVSTGSNCYTVTTGPLYGGKTYSYWYCPR